MTDNPLQQFTVQVFHHDTGRSSTLSPQEIKHAKGEFTIPGLKIGERYSLTVKSPGHLLAHSREFIAKSENHFLEVRTPVPCRVICTLHRNDGGSIEGVRVNLVPQGRVRTVRRISRLITDKSGWAETKTALGKYRVSIFPGGSAKRITRTLDVHMGGGNRLDLDISQDN